MLPGGRCNLSHLTIITLVEVNEEHGTHSSDELSISWCLIFKGS